MFLSLSLSQINEHILRGALKKLHRFQGYHSMMPHLHMLLCAHHPESSLLMLPFFPSLPSSTSPTPFPLAIATLWSVPVSLVFA